MLNPCLYCDGHCCNGFPMLYKHKQYHKRVTVYKNAPDVPKQFHKNGKSWFCDWWKNGKCSDYENRPYFCRNFICRKAVEILDMVQEVNTNV